MKKKEAPKKKNLFNRFSTWVINFTGTPTAFFMAMSGVIIWACLGPVFKYSDTWQLVVNTSTTIITFLMVFIIQQSQNKDTMALQLKLNELIAANTYASNRLVSAEDLTEEELKVLKKFYTKLAALSRDGEDIHSSHSIDEAQNVHESKQEAQKPAKAKGKVA